MLSMPTSPVAFENPPRMAVLKRTAPEMMRPAFSGPLCGVSYRNPHRDGKTICSGDFLVFIRTMPSGSIPAITLTTRSIVSSKHDHNRRLLNEGEGPHRLACEPVCRNDGSASSFGPEKRSGCNSLYPS